MGLQEVVQVLPGVICGQRASRAIYAFENEGERALRRVLYC